MSILHLHYFDSPNMYMYLTFTLFWLPYHVRVSYIYIILTPLTCTSILQLQ